MVTVASVVTNAGLAVFTMEQLDAFSTAARFWFFIGFQWSAFALLVIYCITTETSSGSSSNVLIVLG